MAMIKHNKLNLWVAFSELFLATEIQEYTFEYIAKTIYESDFTLEQAEFSLWNEVYPILEFNKLSSDGIWEGFGDEYILTNIKFQKESCKIKRDVSVSKEIERCWTEIVKFYSKLDQ